jgi:hypothetical protein
LIPDWLFTDVTEGCRSSRSILRRKNEFADVFLNQNKTGEDAGENERCLKTYPDIYPELLDDKLTELRVYRSVDWEDVEIY